jgi:transglutaminase-like putative cysteine protease
MVSVGAIVLKLGLLQATASAPALPTELQPAYQALFVESHTQTAAKVADGYVEEHPESAPALELAWLAHWMLGDGARFDELGIRRARLADPAAWAFLWFTWKLGSHSPQEAAQLAAAARSLEEVAPPDSQGLLVELHAAAERMQGHFERARRLQASVGRIHDWQLIGPFDNTGNAGFDAPYGPEKDVRLDATYPGKNGLVGWRRLSAADPDGRVDLKALLYPGEWTVAYLVTWIYVPASTDAALRVEADDHPKVWLNGRLSVADDTSPAPAAPDQFLAGVHLHKGWNQVLAKVAQRSGGWAFGLRLTTPAGQPLTQLRASADPQPFSLATADEVWPSAPTDPLTRSLDAAQTVIPADYLAAVRLRELGFARRALGAFFTLHASAPHAALYSLGIAQAAFGAEDRDRALSGLAEACRLDPTFIRACVERAEQHLEMGLSELAEGELKAALAVNPESDFALTHAIQIPLHQASFGAARALVRRAERAHPGWESPALILAFIDKGVGNRTEALKHFRDAVARNPDDWTASHELASLLDQLGRADAAAEVLQSYRTKHPTSMGAAEELASLHVKYGEERRAAEVLGTISRTCPEWDLPFRLRALLAERHGDAAATLADYREALRREPSNDFVRDQVERLDETKHLVDSLQISHSEVLARSDAIRQDDYPGANAVVVLDQQIDVLHEDGSVRTYKHKAFKVFDATGVDQHLNWDFGEGSNRTLFYAATVAPDGTEHESTSIDGNQLHFAALTPGSTAEISYRVDQHRNATGGDYWWTRHSFVWADPLREGEWVVMHPKDKAVQFWTRGFKPVESSEDIRGLVAHHFRVRDRPAVHAEEAMPSWWSSTQDALFASTIPSWDRVAGLIHALTDDQVTDDVDLRGQALRLTAQAKSVEDKVAALANFVSNDIRYNQADLSLYTMRPHPATRVLESRYGDCKDKAVLFIALARQLGINAELALLLTHSAGATPKEIPTAWFNHAIAYLPQQSGLSPRFLDLTADELGPRDLPYEDQQALALVVRPGEAGFHLEQIAAATAEHDSTDTATRVVIGADGSATATTEMIARGEAARGWRQAWRREDQRKRFIEGFEDWLHRGGQPIGIALSSPLSEPAAPFSIKMEARIAQLIRHSGKDWLLRPDGVPDWRQFTSMATRQLPIDWEERRHRGVRRTYVLPAGMSVRQLPADVRLDTPFFNFSITYAREDTGARIDTVAETKVSVIEPADFPAFREALLTLYAAVERDVVVSQALPPPRR